MAYDTSLYVYGNELIVISLVLPTVILVFLSIFGIYVETDFDTTFTVTLSLSSDPYKTYSYIVSFSTVISPLTDKAVIFTS